MGLFEVLLPSSIHLVLIVTSIGLFVWYYLFGKLNYWKNRGVPYISLAQCWRENSRIQSEQKHSMYFFNEWYEKFKGHRYAGTFHVIHPSLLIRDPQIIKIVLVKAFANFHDRNLAPDEKKNELSGNLVELTGKTWHQVRQKVSPAFSSAKMKIMYYSMRECAQELILHLQESCSKAGETEIEAKELMSNYTLDVIGAIAMGVKFNAIQDPNCEFKRVVNRLFRLDKRRSLYSLLEAIHPKLPKLLRLNVVEPELREALSNVCKEAFQMKKRVLSSTSKDFLQTFMNIHSSEVEKLSESTKDPVGEVKKSEYPEGSILTEKVVTGIVSTFLAAGFETIASTLAFCLYELALHPDIQDRIFKEIQTVQNEVSGDISYEDLKKCQYVDQVVNETLRKYPVAVQLVRYCTEPFKIPDSSVVVEKGVRLVIPTYGIHHDSDYFPEPEKFDPDRFSENNINKIVPGTYLPFGDGPRACIAMRLALIEVKTMLITMVSNFYLHTCAKTPKTIQFDINFFTLRSKDGLYLQLKNRK